MYFSDFFQINLETQAEFGLGWTSDQAAACTERLGVGSEQPGALMALHPEAPGEGREGSRESGIGQETDQGCQQHSPLKGSRVLVTLL